ncbi:MAG: hypothetical protein KC656_14630, partial [Myxococcales bacterium]|nr:hypothetical protein [Myxococcales bacterium]
LARGATLRPDGFQGARQGFVVRDDGALITRAEPGLVTPEGLWVHAGHYYDTVTLQGQWLTACNAQHGTHVWDLATGSVVAELPDARLERAVASPDGRWVFGVDRRGRVCAFERGLPACRAAVEVEPEGQATHNQVVWLGPDRLLVACRHGLMVLDTTDLAGAAVDARGAPVRDLDGPEALVGLDRPDLEQALFQWLSPLFPAPLASALREVTALARQASIVDGELVVVFEEDVDFRFAGPFTRPWAPGDEVLQSDPLGPVLRAFAGCRFDPDERRDFTGTLAPYGPDGFAPLAALPPDQQARYVVVLAFDHGAWAFDRSGSGALVEVFDGHGVHPDSDHVPAPEVLLRCMRHHLCV